MNFSTRKVCFTLLPTYFKFTFICCHTPHEYVLLVLTVNAVFSHLLLTNGCTVKKVNENKKFCRHTVPIFFGDVSGNKQPFCCPMSM